MIVRCEPICKASVLVDNFRLYIAVVEQGSFSKAAKKLGITQPTVSKQIDRLEEKLGSKLFKRSTRKLLLTAGGERYFERATEIDALVRAAEQEVRHISNKDQSILRIATSPALATNVLPTVLKQLTRAHPSARYQLRVHDTSALGYYQQNFELEYDLFIREGESAEKNMSFRPLGDVPLGLYASPEYIREHGSPSSLADLSANHRCISTRMGRANPWMEKILGDLSVQSWEWGLTSNEGISLVAYAEAGLGVLFLAEYLVRSALEAGTLVKLDIELGLQYIPVIALYRREYLTPLARQCLDLLIEYMEAEYPRQLKGRAR